MSNKTGASNYVAILLFVSLWLITPLEAGLIGVSFTGQVVNIDTSTGAGTLIGASGLTETLSIARDPSGTLFTADSGDDRLATIDPNTGLATLGPAITGLGTFNSGVSGLAFSAGDVLFATAFNSVGNTNLYTINTASGAATLIGLVSSTNVTDIAFSQSGTLYAWDLLSTNGGLMTVNTSTGAGTLVQSGLTGLPTITSLAFDASGNLWGAQTNLYRINTGNSASTLIGPTGFDVRGIAFTVPEPGTLSIVGIGLLALSVFSLIRMKLVPLV